MPSLGQTMTIFRERGLPQPKWHPPVSKRSACLEGYPKLGGSEVLDRGFRLQQDRNSIANRVHSFALVALQRLFAAQYQGLAAHRTSEDFQQFWCNHGDDFSKIKRSIDILKSKR